MSVVPAESSSPPRPLVAVTLGDVAGIGPEVAVRALLAPEIRSEIRGVVVGDPRILHKALAACGLAAEVRLLPALADVRNVASLPGDLLCVSPSTVDVGGVAPGRLDPRAGAAAFDWLLAATDAALAGIVDAVVTAPLNKAALHLAGHHYPGHTEILAERCGVREFAMMLYVPAGPIVRAPHGLGVAHVTLHTSLRSVPGLLTTAKVLETIRLVAGFTARIGAASPRIGVCALNPHAGEDGLFGDEESRIIQPAVAQARAAGIDAVGPLPADTLLHRAVAGEFDGVVAMYHDQGHIALKLIGFHTAVNITLGLPIVRTSPSHGTAFEIAGKGLADPSGMQHALRIAARLAAPRHAGDRYAHRQTGTPSTN